MRRAISGKIAASTALDMGAMGFVVPMRVRGSRFMTSLATGLALVPLVVMNTIFHQDPEKQPPTSAKSFSRGIALGLSIPVVLLILLVLYMILMQIFPSIAPH